jgi:hypothetical protein
MEREGSVMAEETWQAIPGASLYEASSHGRVRSWNYPYNPHRKRRKTPLILVQHRRSDGYLQVKITDDEGVCLTRKTHRLVLLAFLGSPPGDWTASHMNNDPGDNRIENLSWEALSQNVRRQVPGGTRIGKRRRGEAHHSTPLTTDDVLTIRRAYRPGLRGHGAQAIAKGYGISKQAVLQIVRRKTWAHVEDEAA